MKNHFKSIFKSMMLLMLFAFSLSANAQRLDSRDTSQLIDNTIFATQDTNLAGTYRWSQTPYSVLRDSLYHNYNPTRGLVFGDEAAYLASPSHFDLSLGLDNFTNRNFLQSVGAEKTRAFFRTDGNASNVSISSGSSSNPNLFSALYLTTASHVSTKGNRIIANWADTADIFNGVVHYPDETNRVFFDIELDVYAGTNYRTLGHIQARTLEAFTASSMPVSLEFKTTKRGANTNNETLVLSKFGNGKWYGENYVSSNAGVAVFGVNGVLEKDETGYQVQAIVHKALSYQPASATDFQAELADRNAIPDGAKFYFHASASLSYEYIYDKTNDKLKRALFSDF